MKTRAVRDGLVVVADQGFLSLATFVVGIFVARGTNDEIYSTYMLGWTIVLSFKGVQEALVNLPHTVVRTGLPDDEARLYQGSTLVHTSIFCLLTLFLLAIVSVVLEMSFGLQSGTELQLGVLFAVLTALTFRDYFRNSLLAQLNFWGSVSITSFVSLGVVLVTFTMYVNNSLTQSGVYLVFSVGFTITACSMFWMQRSEFTVSSSRLYADFKENWGFGKWALVGNFVFALSRQSVPWIILYISDFDAAAAYFACLSLAIAPGTLLRGMSAYLLPRMSHTFNRESLVALRRILKKSLLILCWPYLAWFSIGSLFGKDLLTLVYGEEFSEYQHLLSALLFMACIDFVFAPLTSGLQTLRQTKELTYSLAVGALITILTCPIFVLEYGVIGAGYSSALSISGTVIYRWYVLRRVITSISS
ncbi:MAG: lipopolysaccharide biosynthesis protein [Pseudomonadota bacterium]